MQFRRVFDNAYLLLILTTLMWGGNAVASRLSVGEVSPMVMTFLRWLFTAVMLWLGFSSQLRAELPLMRRHLPYILIMSVLGFCGFNALMFSAALYTTAVNISLLQGALPVIVLAGALLVFRTPVTLSQVFGILITLAGVALVASRGDLSLLREFSFNFGDILMLCACASYAAYTVALRRRPALSSIGLFAAMCMGACVVSVGFLILEMLYGRALWPHTPTGVGLVAYVTLMPSLLSQIFFIRSVEMIGPGRAGLFINLVPVFGSLMAVLVLSEPFHPYHGLALALVLGGIYLAEKFKS